MVAAARYPGPMNATLPIATGQVIGYIRRPEEFKLNQYAQYVNVPSPNGTWYELDRDQPIRVVTVAEFAFADGDMAPSGNTNLSNFQLQEFRCERYAVPFTLGEEAVQLHRTHAGIDPISWEAMQCAAQMMTLRTRNFWDLADTTATWTGFTATATALGGGLWVNATSALPYIQKTLIEVYRRIRLNTNGRAQLRDLRLVMNPVDAIKTAASQEIHDFVKSSVYSAPLVEGKEWNPNQAYGLPENLYGIPVVVEDSPYVSTRPVAGPTTTGPGTRAHIKAENQAVVLYRPGGMDAPFGTRSFSTIQMFYYKYEMSVESEYDGWNKLHKGRVVDWHVFKPTAVPSGFEITAITS